MQAAPAAIKICVSAARSFTILASAMQKASLVTLLSTAAMAGFRMWVLAALPLGKPMRCPSTTTGNLSWAPAAN